MPMPMVRIREMRMPVDHRLVPVQVDMGGCWLVGTVVMVVLVMLVGMLVLQRLVAVVVFVALGQMQPDTDAHQGRCRRQTQGHRLVEQQH